MQIAASTARGRRKSVMSPTTVVTGRRRRAASSRRNAMDGAERSSAVIRYPRRARRRLWCPVPHATSRTRRTGPRAYFRKQAARKSVSAFRFSSKAMW